MDQYRSTSPCKYTAALIYFLINVFLLLIICVPYNFNEDEKPISKVSSSLKSH